MWWRLIQPVKAFGLRRFVNLLVNQMSSLLSIISRKVIVLGKPYAISIEPTNYCNLSCPECISGKKAFTRPYGYIDFELYKKVVDDVKTHVTYLMLNFQGESFLHPDLIKMIEYARSENIFVSVSTNGHFIDKQGFKPLIDSGLSELIISLDGTSQEVYEKYRVGGDFEKVLENIRGLVKEKEAKESNFPIIKLQFLVFSFNEHQMQEAKKLACNLNINKLVFKSAQLYDLNNTENRTLPTKNKKFARYSIDTVSNSFKLKKNRLAFCQRLWSTSVITQDGSVVPCCYDKDAEFSFGNISHESFEMIWKNSKYQSFRKHVMSKQELYSICRNCIG